MLLLGIVNELLAGDFAIVAVGSIKAARNDPGTASLRPSSLAPLAKADATSRFRITSLSFTLESTVDNDSCCREAVILADHELRRPVIPATSRAAPAMTFCNFRTTWASLGPVTSWGADCDRQPPPTKPPLPSPTPPPSPLPPLVTMLPMPPILPGTDTGAGRGCLDLSISLRTPLSLLVTNRLTDGFGDTTSVVSSTFEASMFGGEGERFIARVIVSPAGRPPRERTPPPPAPAPA